MCSHYAASKSLRTVHTHMQVVKLNLNSSFYILRSAVKQMMTSGGGSLVFCSSAVAKHGIPNHEAIAAAKAGIQGTYTRPRQAHA